jgi:hypothetical protein
VKLPVEKLLKVVGVTNTVEGLRRRVRTICLAAVDRKNYATALTLYRPLAERDVAAAPDGQAKFIKPAPAGPDRSFAQTVDHSPRRGG